MSYKKIYSFFDVNPNKKILRKRSNGYFNDFKSLPKEFTIEDVNACPHFSDAKKQKIASLKLGTVLVIAKLCGWSGASGDAEYLAIKCIDDGSDTTKTSLKGEISNLKRKLSEIQAEIDLKAGHLIKEKGKLERSLKKLNDKLEKTYY